VARCLDIDASRADPLAARLRANHVCRRTYALQSPMDPAPATLLPTSAETSLCDAPGCGRALTPAQVSREARACSPRCRVAAHRERRKRARLAEIDAAIRVLEELRVEIARG
jgi:hypothetical protein